MTTMREQLISDEGGFRQPYRDSRGIWTIGCGHNVESGPPIKMALLVELFDDDLKFVSDQAMENFPFIRSWDMPRAAVIVNMCFCMGIGKVRQFRNMLAAASVKNWPAAACHLRDSNFWRDETHNRAERLARQLESGEWITENKKDLVA